MIVFENNPNGICANWLCRKVSYQPTAYFRVLARVEGARVLGAVGYDAWNLASCQMHVGGEGNWLTRELLFKAFDYPFNVCRLNCIFGMVPSGNEEALRFDRHLGFKDVVELKGAHPDGSLFLLRMDRADCKWIRGKYAWSEERCAA